MSAHIVLVLIRKLVETMRSSLGQKLFLAVCGEGQRRNGLEPEKMNTRGRVPGSGWIGIQPLSTASFMYCAVLLGRAGS
jgi:hypothetical protein